MKLMFSRLIFIAITLWMPEACLYASSEAADSKANPSSDAVRESPVLKIDASKTGRIFEGIGAVSAGASSRLLIDYPEPQRSQILDYLFKPNYGAGFQHLKVEVGGDVNSTDGTEPSHARTRDELLNPKPAYYQRGYEWWLMKEARKRNPGIILDILPWGAPGWIGNGEYFSQDMADYIVAYIKGARQYHGLDIRLAGIWNERYPLPPKGTEYIKLLRKTLDANNLADVKIVAADCFKWDFIKEYAKDPELDRAVAISGDHYTELGSTPQAQACGKPLWDTEDGPWAGTWHPPYLNIQGGKPLALCYNQNYVNGRITKTQIWSPVSSYYDNLPLPGSGIMRANTPWSGAYEVQPAVWITAHTTQFVQPGWVYLDSACTGLPLGGSVVALKSPISSDYSLIIETLGCKQAQTLSFELAGGLSQDSLHVWMSSPDEQFIRARNIRPRNGKFTITVEAERIYSLTTTRGQRKGSATGKNPAAFPLPWEEDFESYAAGTTPRYFSDISGAYEVAERQDQKGRALRQVIPQKGIWWTGPYEITYSVIGETNWRDYQVSADALIETSGTAVLFGRQGSIGLTQAGICYGLWMDTAGRWSLKAHNEVLATGLSPIQPFTWHNLKLRFVGQEIKAFLDGRLVASVCDNRYPFGQAALGSGWNSVQFDNFKIEPVDPSQNLARYKPALASSQSDDNYPASKATDGDLVAWQWKSAPNRGAEEWLEVDLGKTQEINTIVPVFPAGTGITGYRLQVRQGRRWQDIAQGNLPAPPAGLTFPAIRTRRVRLVITSATGTPALAELEVYHR